MRTASRSTSNEPFAPAKLEIHVGFDRMQDILDSESALFTFHEYAEGSATEAQYHGAFGDSEQSQSRFSVQPKLTMTAKREGGQLEHEIVLGGGLSRTDSYYERPADIRFEQYWCVRDQGREGCRDQDGDLVSGPGRRVPCQDLELLCREGGPDLCVCRAPRRGPHYFR